MTPPGKRKKSSCKPLRPGRNNPRPMHWLQPIIAVTTKPARTAGMKHCRQCSGAAPALFIFLFYRLSFTFLTLVTGTLSAGMTCDIRSPFATAMISVTGMFRPGESFSMPKHASLLLTINGDAELHAAHQGLH